MPNTFLESYFRGAEQKQREEMQLREIQAEQARQAFQGVFQQQQLDLQKAGQAQQAEAQKLQASQWQQEQEARRKKDLEDRRVQVMGLMASGNIQQVAPVQKFASFPGAPDYAASMDAPADAQEIPGLGFFRPTTPEERAGTARNIKVADDAALSQENLRQFTQYLTLAEQAGFKVDPEQKGKLLIANLMPNANAVGLLNDRPNSFGEAGAWAINQWGKDLTKKITLNPSAALDPTTLKEIANFNQVREMYEGKPASANPAGLTTNADEERRASRTSQAVTLALANKQINPQSINTGAQLEALKAEVLKGINPADFSLAAFDKAIDNWIKANPRLSLLNGATAEPAVPVGPVR